MGGTNSERTRLATNSVDFGIHQGGSHETDAPRPTRGICRLPPLLTGNCESSILPVTHTAITKLRSRKTSGDVASRARALAGATVHVMDPTGTRGVAGL